jgi:hypothetical protein
MHDSVGESMSACLPWSGRLHAYCIAWSIGHVSVSLPNQSARYVTPASACMHAVLHFKIHVRTLNGSTRTYEKQLASVRRRLVVRVYTLCTDSLSSLSMLCLLLPVKTWLLNQIRSTRHESTYVYTVRRTCRNMAIKPDQIH